MSEPAPASVKKDWVQRHTVEGCRVKYGALYSVIFSGPELADPTWVHWYCLQNPAKSAVRKQLEAQR